MKVSAVISEFNPFHDGHKYLINRARENGSTHIVAVMSGNFVQRGDCAIYSKWDRAVDAVKGGVDLVLEIPSAKSCSSASNFALAGVEITEKCGCVDELFFGSECGDIDALKSIVSVLDREDYKKTFEENYYAGLSYPSARQKTFEMLGETELSAILENPNDILGIEYIRSLEKLNSSITPVCFKRIGENHDSLNDSGSFLSGYLLRQKIINNETEPEHTVHCLKYSERAVIYKLREMTADNLRNVPDVDEGLENRIKECVNNFNSVDDILNELKTKRYTLSRLRRILLCAFLDIERQDVYCPVSYIKVLAFNDRGREILKNMKDSANLPVIMKRSDIYSCGSEKAVMDYEKEVFCSDCFTLMSEKVENCGSEQKNNAFYMEDQKL